MNARINLDQLAQHLRPHLGPLIEKFAPNAKQVANGWRLGNPEGAKGSSCWVGDTGFHDHSSNEQGSHLTFFSRLIGKSIAETARILARETGFKVESRDQEKLRPVAPSMQIGKLTDLHKAALAARGFGNVLDILPIGTASNGDMAFSHFTYGGVLAFVKYYHQPNKSWYSDKGDTQHVPWLIDVVRDRFPDSDTIYITEGHWDAITAVQAGFPAISIPNGASNMHWVENCFDFLHSFDKVVLCYDNDKAGKEALQIASTKVNRPVMVVTMPGDCKDLNDVLLKHGPDAVTSCLSNTQPYSPPEIVRASSLIERASQSYEAPFEFDTPWGRSFDFHVRASESTVVTAYTGHGKSNLMRQLTCHLAVKHDARIGIASFEDTPVRVTNQMIHSLKGMDPERVKKTLDNIQFFDSQHPKFDKKKIAMKELLASFHQMYQRHGTQVFIVDNLMCLDVDREDNGAQADASEELRQFVMGLPLHVFLVAHPRKPPSNAAETKLTPPDPHEIRGAAEIADTAFNILGIVRNIPKERELDIKRKAAFASPDELAKIYRQKPDSVIQVGKQRWNGKLPTLWVWRDGEGNFHETPDRATKWW